jgi:hypothetical protein
VTLWLLGCYDFDAATRCYARDCGPSPPADAALDGSSFCPGNSALNGGFEDGTSNWSETSSGAALTRQAGGYAGTVYAAKVCAVGSDTFFGIQQKPTAVVSPTLGSSYQMDVWAYSDTAPPSLKVELDEIGSTGQITDSSSQTVTLDATWQRISVTHTITGTGASSIGIKLLGSTSVSGSCFLVDEVCLIRVGPDGGGP